MTALRATSTQTNSDRGGKRRLEPVLEGARDESVSAHPFLKWAGGKWAIAPQLTRLLPHDVKARVYREPFLGGGAMFFYMQPERAFLSDALHDLVNTYKVVQASVDALITRLDKLRDAHSTEHYYSIRERYNKEREAPRIERASWLVYLNKTCFNGLYRTNREGSFNVPEGKFKNPRVCDPDKLRLAAAALQDAEIKHQTFDHLLDVAEEGDVIYLDPPYVPLTKTANFAGYTDASFGPVDQERLAKAFRVLDERGCLLGLSNSDTPFVRDLYRGYDLCPILAPRAISAKAATRGDVNELFVRNLDKYPSGARSRT